MPAINIRDIDLNDEEVSMKKRQRPHRRIRQETMKVEHEQYINVVRPTPKYKVQRTTATTVKHLFPKPPYPEKETIVTQSTQATSTEAAAINEVIEPVVVEKETTPNTEPTMQTATQVETNPQFDETSDFSGTFQNRKVLEKDIEETVSIKDYKLKKMFLSKDINETMRRAMILGLFIHLRNVKKGLLFTNTDSAFCMSGVVNNELIGITVVPMVWADGGVLINLHARDVQTRNAVQDRFPDMDISNMTVTDMLTVIELFVA